MAATIPKSMRSPTIPPKEAEIRSYPIEFFG